MGRRFFALAAIVLGRIAMLTGAVWSVVNMVEPTGEIMESLHYGGDPYFAMILLFTIPCATMCLGIAILLPARTSGLTPGLQDSTRTGGHWVQISEIPGFLKGIRRLPSWSCSGAATQGRRVSTCRWATRRQFRKRAICWSTLPVAEVPVRAATRKADSSAGLISARTFPAC